MESKRQRRIVIALAASALVIGTSGAAMAVSGGIYDPGKLDCSAGAEANDRGVEPGCHNTKINVEDSQGNRYVQAGTLQTANGDNVHAGDYEVDANGDGTGPVVSGGADTNYQPLSPDSCGLFDVFLYPVEEAMYLAHQGDEPCKLAVQRPGVPTVSAPTVTPGTPELSILRLAQGGEVWFGADDNLDSGEHDGADGKNGTGTVQNGPSDGGAIAVQWDALDASAMQVVLDQVKQRPGLLLANPIPLASGGFGFCADGICISLQTAKRLVYQGGTAGERNAYDYEGKTWDPEECSSGSSADETKCAGPNPGDPQDMDGWKAREKAVYAEPGVQLYEDPDPQASPLGPYPLPGVYAGTCGVTVGGGNLQVPASPITNSAGQATINTCK